MKKSNNTDVCRPLAFLHIVLRLWTVRNGSWLGDLTLMFLFSSSPGQYAAVCGPKDGMKQGEIKGALGELGYDNDHVFKF